MYDNLLERAIEKLEEYVHYLEQAGEDTADVESLLSDLHGVAYAAAEAAPAEVAEDAETEAQE